MQSPRNRSVPTHSLGSALVSSTLLALLLFTGSQSVRAQVITVPGFRALGSALPKPAKGWAGLSLDKSGRLYSFDGQKVVELSMAAGTIRQTLATLSKPVFGADLIVGPGDNSLYFCESTNGSIQQLDLKTKKLRLVAKIGGPFDLSFHPKEGDRFLYVSARPGFVGTAKVFRIDTLLGSSDLIGEIDGYSGPIHFNARGDLYFAPAPKRANSTASIYRWSASQVRSAIGPAVLKASSASKVASGLPSCYDFSFDGEGTLYVSSAAFANSQLLEVDAATGNKHATGLLRYQGFTMLQSLFVRAQKPFERFGSGGAQSSRLLVLASNFQGKDLLLQLEPSRIGLTVSPGVKPTPRSALTYRATGIPRGAQGLWLLGTGLVPELPLLPLGAGGLSFPDFGLIFSAPLFVGPAWIDAQGKTELRVQAPAVRGLPWTTQLFIGPVPGLKGGARPSPWVTSSPVRVRVQ